MTGTADPVGSALWGIVAGATTGGATLAAGVLVVRWLQVGGSAIGPDVGATILGASAFLAFALAGTSGWHHTRRTRDPWRRGVAGAVAAFGSVLAALPTMIADRTGGRIGIAVYLGVLCMASVWSHRLAGRAAAQ